MVLMKRTKSAQKLGTPPERPTIAEVRPVDSKEQLRNEVEELQRKTEQVRLIFCTTRL